MYFPNYFNQQAEIDEIKSSNLVIQTFGKRLLKDQTLYEYVLEFLLVFASAKVENSEEGKLSFHSEIEEELSYHSYLNIGLKRFIFFDRSKLENRFKIDDEANRRIKEMLKNKLDIDNNKFTDEDTIKILKETFYGFSAILKNRSWFAQSLLPLAPIILFPETMGNKTTRRDMHKDRNIENKNIEYKFDTSKHSFMARGGELYYLHILLGLSKRPDLKEKIEMGLKNIITAISELEIIGNFIQSNWEIEEKIERKTIQNTMGFIPLDYEERSILSCEELTNFLSNEINPLKKIELFSIGIMLQIFRMMHQRVFKLLKREYQPMWIIDCRGKNNSVNIKKIAADCYKKYEEDMLTAISKFLINRNDLKTKKSDVDLLKEARENSILLSKKAGKEIKLIIPSKGPFERFSLSEEIVQFLVLSIIPPGEKLEYDTFLEKLFYHYGMVIGADQMKIYCDHIDIEKINISYFDRNKESFQELLKKCGFLRYVSDATSIVENPYDKQKNE